jgi:hypothetical protein
MTPTRIERDCIVEYEGHKFESGGSIVTPTTIIAYIGMHNALITWHGEAIGTWREVARWRLHSYLGSFMYQIEATVDDVVYTGRSFGLGMMYRGRRKARQPSAKRTNDVP